MVFLILGFDGLFRFVGFHAHLLLFTPLSFSIWSRTVSTPFILLFQFQKGFIIGSKSYGMTNRNSEKLQLLLQICTWRRVKGTMISERSTSALSAPRITTSFPSVATLTITILYKPKAGSVSPFFFPISNYRLPTQPLHLISGFKTYFLILLVKKIIYSIFFFNLNICLFDTF